MIPVTPHGGTIERATRGNSERSTLSVSGINALSGLLAPEAATRSYRDVMTPICPTCGSTGVPLIFGLPDRYAGQAAEDGRIALGGCIVPPDEPPNWECPQQHRWRHGHEADQQALIFSVLRSYGFHDVKTEDVDDLKQSSAHSGVEGIGARFAPDQAATSGTTWTARHRIERSPEHQELDRRLQALGDCPDCGHLWSEHVGYGNDRSGVCGECASQLGHVQRMSPEPGCRQVAPWLT